MLYKTIALHLLQNQTQLHEQLKLQRRLLPVLVMCSEKLKAMHQHWKQVLKRVYPHSPDKQLAAEAMELAIEELRARLPTSLATDEPFSLNTTPDCEPFHILNA